LPVQAVLRSGVTRLYAGRIEAGSIRPGDEVRVGPQAAPANVAHVRIAGRGVARADAGASVAIELAEDRDIARGDVIAAPGVRYSRGVIADLCWLDESPWVRGRRYILRQGALETQVLLDEVVFVHDIADFSRRDAGAGLELNDIANVRLSTRDPILADRYKDLPGAGAIALFDPQTNQTCAAGMIREALS
jgi:sulfate adenylyltransferase subunit 1